ncbi:hypothetical protein BDV95DRAFT_582351 [Massariosphaeria phaeospora]|uniref:Uncharacterized protein n=1 Tax=Massariosphaeria phaeospora TaxID=100035 RepID=A0A7C8M9M1_9PLEO|nr:hypothetical protein BDV95DRAFT_582351 [Massariosphaeria phaeospora]
MRSHTLSDTAPLPRHMFWSFVNAHTVDEISNYPGSVRAYIFNQSMRDDKKKRPGRAEQSIAFCIYQTERYGPQNGYRLCVVHAGYYVGGREKKEGEAEDDIDKLEREIPQGHEEMVVLGEPTLYPDPQQEAQDQ